ncbi:MAG TPA: response regulator [Candidatus Paceibacterota bacterium]
MSDKCVLIVEDSPELADTLQDILIMHGYKALVALSGREGVALALEHHPDLVMLDIRLPDMDGYTVFQKIRSDAWGATARIMILTASESIENISKNINLPLEHIMFKPDSSVALIAQRIEQRLNEMV